MFWNWSMGTDFWRLLDGWIYLCVGIDCAMIESVWMRWMMAWNVMRCRLMQDWFREWLHLQHVPSSLNGITLLSIPSGTYKEKKQSLCVCMTLGTGVSTITSSASTHRFAQLEEFFGPKIIKRRSVVSQRKPDLPIRMKIVCMGGR